MTTRLWRSTDLIRRGRITRAASARWKKFTQSKRGTGMSIEIEVGLENATKVKPRVEELLLDDEKQTAGQPNAKLKKMLTFGGIALFVIVAGLFIYYFNRESTDDAQVDGHITPVSAKVYGRVADALVNDNQ